MMTHTISIFFVDCTATVLFILTDSMIKQEYKSYWEILFFNII